MSEHIYEELIRLSLKRELTPDDHARIEATLGAYPELRERWESDAALGRMLRALPDVPVSSNFTSGVLKAIDLDERKTTRGARSRWSEWLRRVQPRLSWGFAMALIVAFGAYEYRVQQNTREQTQIERAQV